MRCRSDRGWSRAARQLRQVRVGLITLRLPLCSWQTSSPGHSKSAHQRYFCASAGRQTPVVLERDMVLLGGVLPLQCGMRAGQMSLAASSCNSLMYASSSRLTSCMHGRGGGGAMASRWRSLWSAAAAAAGADFKHLYVFCFLHTLYLSSCRPDQRQRVERYDVWICRLQCQWRR